MLVALCVDQGRLFGINNQVYPAFLVTPANIAWTYFLKTRLSFIKFHFSSSSKKRSTSHVFMDPFAIVCRN